MTNWKDIIPSIPLARGVPVLNARGHKRVVVEDFPVLILAPAPTKVEYVAGTERSKVRVDLDDDLGFAYALRHWSQHYDDESGEADEEALQWALSYLGGGITDADRLALAQALKEVMA